MKTRLTVSILAAAAAILLWGVGQTRAVILYSENFDSYAQSSTPGSFGGFGQLNNVGGTPWQVQGGGGGGGISVAAGVDGNGIGGSQSFFANWDHSLASSFTFDQETAYGVIAAPGAGNTLANIQIALGIFMSGSETSNTPIAVELENNSSSWDFTPTLTNGQFTNVQFTGDQATLAGGSNPFDPTQSSNLRIQFGAGGFGFDANNIVRLDNIVAQTVAVPEPASLLLLGLSIPAFVVAGRKLRRKTV